MLLLRQETLYCLNDASFMELIPTETHLNYLEIFQNLNGLSLFFRDFDIQPNCMDFLYLKKCTNMYFLNFTSFSSYNTVDLYLPPNLLYLNLKFLPAQNDIYDNEVYILLEEIFFNIQEGVNEDEDFYFWNQSEPFGKVENFPERLQVLIYSGPLNMMRIENPNSTSDDLCVNQWSKLKSVIYAQFDSIFIDFVSSVHEDYKLLFHSISDVEYLSLGYLFGFEGISQEISPFPVFRNLKYLRLCINSVDRSLIDHPHIFNKIFPNVDNLTITATILIERNFFNSLTPSEFGLLSKVVGYFSEFQQRKHLVGSLNTVILDFVEYIQKVIDENQSNHKRITSHLNVRKVWIQTEVIYFYKGVDYHLKIGQVDRSFDLYLKQNYPIEQQTQCVSAEIF